jgi:hypothetical protein
VYDAGHLVVASQRQYLISTQYPNPALTTDGTWPAGQVGGTSHGTVEPSQFTPSAHAPSNSQGRSAQLCGDMNVTPSHPQCRGRCLDRAVRGVLTPRINRRSKSASNRCESSGRIACSRLTRTSSTSRGMFAVACGGPSKTHGTTRISDHVRAAHFDQRASPVVTLTSTGLPCSITSRYALDWTVPKAAERDVALRT